MSPRKVRPQGPSPSELKSRSELDQLRREVRKLKAGVSPSEASATGDPNALAAPSGDELEALRGEVADLTETRQRLSRLYFNQVDENRKRAQKLHQILENISQINSDLDLDKLLQHLCEVITSTLGFRVVLIRMREPGTQRLVAGASSGIDAAALDRLRRQDVGLDDFLSWLRDEFKVSRSYFISHSHAFNGQLPSGHRSGLGERGDCEWHEDDVLLVPLFSRAGELVGYFSVDDPVDRLVPSSETIELIEIFANHAVVAIENARLYRQLEQHSRDLEDAGTRMQEMHILKSQFVSTVSHELRTPLTAIRAYVDAMLSAGEGEISHEQQQRFLSIVNEESQRLARLIESVLDLNRFDSGDMRRVRQTVDLAEMLREACEVLAPVAHTGQVALKLECALADTRVDADRDQMRQLVLHLGSNAVKFTPPGGQVTVRLSGDGRDVQLQVEDTGIGIPAGELEKIFDRFYQVDSSLVRRYGGTGLGLAICKSIVEWHGGRVFAESAPDCGSRFTVVLPRRTGPRVVVRTQSRSQTATEDVLRLGIEMVSEVMNARMVSLLVPDANGDLRIVAAAGLDESVMREACIKPGTGVAGWVAENGRPVCVSGHQDTGGVTGSGRAQYRSGTFLSVPIEGKHELLGVLNVTDPISQTSFDAEDCHLLLHLAERVATAWEQARAMEESQGEVDGTAQALRQVLQHLGNARRNAPDRVRLARALARGIGMNEAEVGVLSFAASVHDVGMERVSPFVTGGEGGLAQQERERLEHHPEEGVRMLRPLERMSVVKDVILSHHEWWDGSGYPRGLREDEIPLGGRILAVVDAWESMTVGRAHRPACSRVEALGELYRLRGRQFDPRVVDVFEVALKEVEQQNAADSTAPGGPGTEPAIQDAGR